MKKETASTEVLQKEVEELRAAIEALNKASVTPMSYKPTPKAVSSGDMKEVFTNMFDLPSVLKKEITDKGYAYKFINFNKFRKESVHKSHWIPYRPEVKTVQSMSFGVDPDGYVVRGDCVLAVRTLDQDRIVKGHIAKRNQALNNYNLSAKEELTEMFKDRGFDAKVSSGYDEE